MSYKGLEPVCRFLGDSVQVIKVIGVSKPKSHIVAYPISMQSIEAHMKNPFTFTFPPSCTQTTNNLYDDFVLWNKLV